MLSFKELNKNKNIIKISISTIPNDLIWELNKDCNISLYNTINPLITIYFVNTAKLLYVVFEDFFNSKNTKINSGISIRKIKEIK